MSDADEAMEEEASASVFHLNVSQGQGNEAEEANNLSNLMIKIGEKFCSFEHYKTRIKEHERVTRTRFSLMDSKLLTWFSKPGKNPQKVAHANPEIKYFSLTACCVRGKNNRRTVADKDRLRNKLSMKLGCPALFHIKMTPDGQSLQVMRMVREHNHPVGQEEVKLTRQKAMKMKVVVHEGFIYRRTTPKGGEAVLKCQTVKCKGQAIEDKDDNVIIVVAHNHDSTEESQKMNDCLKKMEERAISEAIPVEQIFAEEAEKNPDVITRKSEGFLIKTLSKKRLQTEPEVPESLLSLSNLLVSDQYRHRYGCNLEEFPRELFIGCIKAKGSEVAAIFASLFLCERFNGPVDEMHIDCSFNDLPSVPDDMKYILSIHFVKKKMFYPSIFAFTSSRSSSMIKGLLMYLKEEVMQNTAPDMIYVDFKWQINLVLSEQFPGSIIEHSYIYFTKDIWSQAHEIGLMGLQEQEYVIFWIQQLICLPFLPADQMLLALLEFEKSLPDEMVCSPVMVLLIRYIQETWLDTFGDQNLSTHENHGRSNLLVNQFHKKIIAALKIAKEPTVWTIIKCLQTVERDSSKCYTNEISNIPINSNTLLYMCQMAYDERVKKIEHEVLTEKIDALSALEPLSKRPVIHGLTPEDTISFTDTCRIQIEAVANEEVLTDGKTS
ncbi:Hypothetical predicted protein [Cloeon dipterum]|uniref:ZSWIM3 N-terminal domain-containing protein n=1 Tax=Cloeon dipterum TaxID=197152 RepID=A0A8S1CF20_9INSE|nr:Hypothetical predicted protein [Cloeon dipterum]